MPPAQIFDANARIRFHQAVGAVVANRVRFHAANSQPDLATPFDEVRPQPAPDADGFTYITVGSLPLAATLNGEYDVAITAVDASGKESPFLDIDDVDFDTLPLEAPTDGSVVE